MPSATSTKPAESGKKRKAAPVKNAHVKESKKARIDSTEKSASKSKSKSKSLPIQKKVVLPSESEAESDSDSDGGVPIEAGDDEDEEETADGLHPDRVKAVATNSQSSKEARVKQKALIQERKASKPLAEQLARMKKIWERLRRKSQVPKDERAALVTELYEFIPGKIKDLVLKHDSVRVVQTAIKYSNPEQRRMIAKELAGTYRELAESKYAKFLVGKLLVHDDDEIRDLIVPEFYGHVRRLIKHPEASWILDDIYRGVATKQQKAIILREWYGPEFAIFKEDSKKLSGDLADILAVEPGKRAPIMRSLQELINSLIQKKMTGFTLLHDAMLQYFLNAKPGTEEVTEYLEIIKGDEEGDLLKNLAFTEPGSRVVCLALAHGTAKDRRQILKTYKGEVLQMMAADRNGHVIILTAYEVVDDTVLLSKSIFSELLSKEGEKQVEDVRFAANDLNARTTLLYLFQGRSGALFPPSHKSDLDILAEVDKIRVTTSKKDPEVRRSALAKSLSPFLLKAIEAAAGDLIATSFGCQFVTEVLLGAEGDKAAALEAVAKTAGGDPTTVPVEVAGDFAQETLEHPANTAWAAKTYKTLIAGGRFDKATKSIVPIVPALNFADVLYPYIKDHLLDWATGSSSFIVLALLETNDFLKRDEVLKTLRDNKKKLQKAASEETADQKARREQAATENKTKDGKNKSKKSKLVKERSVGNKGCVLLLEKL